MNIEEANTNYDIEELKKLYPDAEKIAPFKPFKPYIIEIDKLHSMVVVRGLSGLWEFIWVREENS